MLTDTIAACIDSIEKKTNAQGKKKYNENLSSNVLSLVKICDRLKNALIVLDEMKNNNLTETGLSNKTKSDLIDSISACGKGLNDVSLNNSIVNEFDAQIKLFEQLLKFEWEKSAKKYSAAIIGDLTILGDLINPQRTKELLHRIKEGVDSVPSIEVVKEFMEDIEEGQALAAEYTMNPQIEEFFLKVKQSKASISDLNQDVLSWLKDNNLLNKLKISF